MLQTRKPLIKNNSFLTPLLAIDNPLTTWFREKSTDLHLLTPTNL